MVSATAEFSRHNFGLSVPPLSQLRRHLSSSLLKSSFVAVPETSGLGFALRGKMCRQWYLTLVREA